MAVRSAMQPLIDVFRQRGQASTTDSFLSVTYWTDQQLQDILDAHRDWRTVSAVAVSTSGLIVKGDVPKEGVYPDPDTATFLDDDEEDLVLPPTWSTATREWTLTAESEDLVYVNAAWISLNMALADLWGQKAAQRSDYINFKAGQNKMDMQQEYQHCCEMRDYWLSKRMKLWTLQKR